MDTEGTVLAGYTWQALVWPAVMRQAERSRGDQWSAQWMAREWQVGEGTLVDDSGQAQWAGE